MDLIISYFRIRSPIFLRFRVPNFHFIFTYLFFITSFSLSLFLSFSLSFFPSFSLSLFLSLFLSFSLSLYLCNLNLESQMPLAQIQGAMYDFLNVVGYMPTIPMESLDSVSTYLISEKSERKKKKWKNECFLLSCANHLWWWVVLITCLRYHY